MAYQFTTASTSPNPYIACTINNIGIDKDDKSREEKLDKEVPQDYLRNWKDSGCAIAVAKYY